MEELRLNKFQLWDFLPVPVAVIVTYLVHHFILKVHSDETLYIVMSLSFFGLLQGAFAYLITKRPSDHLTKMNIGISEQLKSVADRLDNQVSRLEMEDNILPEGEIIEIEKKANSIWIISKDLKADHEEPFKSIVLENLKDGKEYIWLVPNNKRKIGPAINSLKNAWKKHMLTSPQWQFILVDVEYFVHPHDLVIYDADDIKHARIVEFFLGEGRTVGYNLPRNSYEELIGIATEWINKGRDGHWESIVPPATAPI